MKAFIEKGKVAPLNETQAEAHFQILTQTLETAGFEHYEISNFGKPGYYSRNNTAYWLGKPYLGIGPSAHSFYENKRGWNIANNTRYIKAIEDDIVPVDYEELTTQDQYNEYVMTGLRTIWGISPSEVAKRFGESYKQYFLSRVAGHLKTGELIQKGEVITASPSGKFLIDGIASDLFRID